MTYISAKTISASLLVLISLTGCGFFQKKPVEQNPLVTAECPDTLGELKDDTFGATTMKLSEVAGIYFTCLKAVKAGKEK